MHSQTLALLIVSVLLPISASTAVAVRITAHRAAARYLKKSATSSLNASDYLIFVALVLTWALGVTAICGASIGRIGTPPLEQSPEEFEVFLKVMFAAQLFYIFSVGFVKLSFLAFYRRIFITKRFRLVCDVTTGVVIAWLVSLFFGVLLRSQPISLDWLPKQPGTLGNIVILYSFVGASDTALDIFILCLPISAIRNLHMSTRKKWIVGGMFGLGGFCVISSTVRLVFVIKFAAQYTGLGSYYSSLVVKNFIWLIIEPCASVMAACLPTYGPLFHDGRSPGSIIRSIRSILSIRSQSSKSSSYGSHKHSHEYTPDSELGKPEPGIRAINYGHYSTHVESEQQNGWDSESQRKNLGILVLRETDVSSGASAQL